MRRKGVASRETRTKPTKCDLGGILCVVVSCVGGELVAALVAGVSVGDVGCGERGFGVVGGRAMASDGWAKGGLWWFVERGGVGGVGACVFVVSDAAAFCGVDLVVGGVCGRSELGRSGGGLADALGEIWSGTLDLGEAPIFLGTLILLGVLLALPFFVRPYLGRLGLHVLVGLLWGWFVLWGVQAVGGVSRWVWGGWSLGGLGLCVGWVVWWPASLPNHEVVYSASVGGERVTLNARRGEGMQVLALVSERSTLYQSIQAYRTAEMIVHPAMARSKATRHKILLLGGEDGTILREIAKYPEGAEVVWVPLFSIWADFFQKAPHFSEIHEQARKRLRIKKLGLSAFFQPWEWSALLEKIKAQGSFSLIFADLPPPTEALQMLYTARTKKALLAMLSLEGVLVESSASPYRQRPLFWCLAAKWAEVGAYVVPFHLSPSLLGDHGFVWVLRKPFEASTQPLKITVPTRYLTPELPFHTFMRFARDVNPDGREMEGACTLPSL